MIKVSSEEILDFIKSFQMAYPGVSPSYREIMFAMGIQSTATVKDKLGILTEEHEVEPYFNGSNVYRGIILTDSVLLTREEARELGVDWKKLVSLKQKNRKTVEVYLDGYGS